MKTAKAVGVIIFVLLVSGCSGVKFKDVAADRPLTDDYTNRNLYKQTALFKYNLDQLAGSVLVQSEGTNDYKRVGRLIDQAHPPAAKQIDKQAGQIYTSKITSNASAQGSYLAFAANLSAKQTVDVTINDVLQVFIDDKYVPKAELQKEARKQRSTTGVKKYWVQGVLLTTVSASYFTEIESDASGVVGSTFGLGGKVYNSDGTTTNDYRIALELIDLDTYNTIFSTNTMLSDETFEMYKNAFTPKKVTIESILVE